ncbi:MAG: thioredoxin [Rikenellaceae bacterium]
MVSIAGVGCISNAQSSSNVKTESKMGTVKMTKADFLKRVTDFESNPNEWNYLGDKPALIDFYASWCGPCKMIAPILEDLAEEYKDQIVIYKVDTEAEPELATLFNIRSIPTLLFIPMEGQPQLTQGAMSKEQFKATIDKVLLNK